MGAGIYETVKIVGMKDCQLRLSNMVDKSRQNVDSQAHEELKRYRMEMLAKDLEVHCVELGVDVHVGAVHCVHGLPEGGCCQEVGRHQGPQYEEFYYYHWLVEEHKKKLTIRFSKQSIEADWVEGFCHNTVVDTEEIECAIPREVVIDMILMVEAEVLRPGDKEKLATRFSPRRLPGTDTTQMK